MYVCVALPLLLRGKTSFDQAGLGVEAPGDVAKEDSAFETYRKRMMLAYRFRPNPLVKRREGRGRGGGGEGEGRGGRGGGVDSDVMVLSLRFSEQSKKTLLLIARIIYKSNTVLHVPV